MGFARAQNLNDTSREDSVHFCIATASSQTSLEPYISQCLSVQLLQCHCCSIPACPVFVAWLLPGTLQRCAGLSEVLHNLVEAIRYPCLGDQLILQETEPVFIIVLQFIVNSKLQKPEGALTLFEPLRLWLLGVHACRQPGRHYHTPTQKLQVWHFGSKATRLRRERRKWCGEK